MIARPILISGKQGSGKSTLTAQLCKQLNSRFTAYAKEFKFAQTIYDIHNFARGRLADLGIEVTGVKDGRLLQLLGTEWGRMTLGDDVWVRACTKEIEKFGENIPKGSYAYFFPIISDCRFENEFEGFKHAFKVRLTAAEEVRKKRCEAWRDTSNHLSETGLDHYEHKFDLVIHTDTSNVIEVANAVLNEMGNRETAMRNNLL